MTSGAAGQRQREQGRSSRQKTMTPRLSLTAPAGTGPRPGRARGPAGRTEAPQMLSLQNTITATIDTKYVRSPAALPGRKTVDEVLRRGRQRGGAGLRSRGS